MDHSIFMRDKWDSKTKIVNYLVIFSLCTLVMLLLNPFFCLIYGTLDVVDFSSYQSTADTRVWLDSRSYYNDLGEHIELNGWAFASTSKPDDEKEIQIVLYSDKVCYKVNTMITEREGVTNAFQSAMDLYGDQHGFVVKFSTLSMKDGTYDLYAYCKENAEAEGIAYLNAQLIKKKEEVEIRTQAQPSVGSKQMTEVKDFPQMLIGLSDLNYWIDRFEMDTNGHLNIVGWSFCETEGDNSKKVINMWLKSEGNAYRCAMNMVDRQDVYDHFKDAKKVVGIHHGFSGLLNLSDMPQGIYDLYIECNETESEHGITNTGRQVIIDENGVRLS